ncbi:MAG: DUF814 domain-containing protein [Bacteroidetes bacterium]|nr:DUF814 domain-containing protein [Bacteroidota bacterium]
MFKDYFYLKRCAQEFNNVLSGELITSVYSQEKDRLYFSLPCPELPDRHLIISANPQLPFLQIRNRHIPAKKNKIEFFTEYLPDEIISIEISPKDRIIKIKLHDGVIFFFIRGSKSNICFIKNDEMYFFKKSNDEFSVEIAKELKNAFTPEGNDTETIFDENQNLDYSEIKRLNPSISKKLFFEAKSRCKNNTIVEFNKNLGESIEEIYNSPICVSLLKQDGSMNFLPETFVTVDMQNVIGVYSNYNDAISNYATNFYKFQKEFNLRKRITAHIEKDYKFISDKLNKLKGRIEKGSKDDLYYKFGNVLLMNLDKIMKGMGEITLKDYESEAELKIKLPEKLTSSKIVNYYFDKAKDEKKNFAKSKELFEETKSNYEIISAHKQSLNNSVTLDELESLSKLLKINNAKERVSNLKDGLKMFEYLIENKYSLFVGRDSKTNDMLSTKFGKQNDYWFHARGLPGSHVLLRVDNPKEVVPKNVLKYAASVAAFYSKAKTAGIAPVSYTLRKFVRKNKNMNPGEVTISKESVLLVKPEIPVKCILITD